VKKIEFVPISKDAEKLADPPKPAKSFVPDWYKNLNSFITEEKIPIHYDGTANVTIKRCIPFMDAMFAGYMYHLPCDIHAVDPDKYNGTRISLGGFSLEAVVSEHYPDQISGMPIFEDFDQIFKWNFWWRIKTPPGYSCLFVHPFHRNELPFLTMSGVVDTDSYNVPILFPFFLKNNFFGTIPRGTPLVQIIPFKRDSWKMSSPGFNEDIRYDVIKNLGFSLDGYKKRFWKRKEYS
jgi:hypothetical protein